MNQPKQWTNLTGLILVFSCAFSASAVEGEAPAVKKDRQVIAGKWKVSKLVINGSAVDSSGREKLEVINHPDGKWELHSDGRMIGKGNSEIRPQASPKEIDFDLTEGDGAGRTFEGIYKLDTDTRSLCFAATSEGRPKTFASPVGSQTVWVEFKRVSSKRE